MLYQFVQLLAPDDRRGRWRSARNPPLARV